MADARARRAQELSQASHHKTVTAQDILDALVEMEMEVFLPKIQPLLQSLSSELQRKGIDALQVTRTCSRPSGKSIDSAPEASVTSPRPTTP